MHTSTTYTVNGTPRAAFHVTRHNPLVNLADETIVRLLAIRVPDTYLSPDWRVSPNQGAKLEGSMP